jgi:hypothetical protein
VAELRGSLVFGRLVAGQCLLVAVEFDDDVTVASRPFDGLVLAAADEEARTVLGEGFAVALDVLFVRSLDR